MVYFIIFLSIAAVLGPLMAVIPSRRQREVAKRRDKARGAGVTVKLWQPDDVPPRLQRVSDAVLVCYLVRLPKKGADQRLRDLWVRTREGWRSRSSEPVPLWVQALPDSAEVASVTWDDARVYWSEKGDEQDVDIVIQALQTLADGGAAIAPARNPIP